MRERSITAAHATLLKKQGRLTLEAVDLPALFADTIEVMQLKAWRRNLELKIETPQRLIHPSGDRERIADGVWHLLDNAIKFTRHGGQVTVRARV